MRLASSFWKPPKHSIGNLAKLGIMATLVASGCGKEAKINYSSVSEPPTVQLLRPPVRDIVRVVGQPSFIEAYERTSIYPKMTAYIEKWIVDIGDKVKKGETLATLFVPELVEDFGTKNATVKLDQERIELAEKGVKVAEADEKAAAAYLAETKSMLARYQAEVDRWDSEVKRLSKEVQNNVVSPQILLESQNQLKSSTATRESARSTIDKAAADLLSKQAGLDQARIAVSVARADLSVAESESRRLKAWVGYLTLTAPFDGIIVVRNANTADFVLPATGDPTAMNRSPDVSSAGAAPIYVVDRTDIVRIFVDIPEQDANFVPVGTKASVMVRAFKDQAMTGSVTRSSWALNVKSRTLRAEIDLPNPGGRLLPGMYAYAKVIISRPGVRAVPPSSIEYSGDQAYCWLCRDGKAHRVEIQTGVSNGDWVEVTNRLVSRSAGSNENDVWTSFDGSEEVILGDHSTLSEGEPVKVDNSTDATKAH